MWLDLFLSSVGVIFALKQFGNVIRILLCFPDTCKHEKKKKIVTVGIMKRIFLVLLIEADCQDVLSSA